MKLSDTWKLDVHTSFLIWLYQLIIVIVVSSDNHVVGKLCSNSLDMITLPHANTLTTFAENLSGSNFVCSDAKK